MRDGIAYYIQSDLDVSLQAYSRLHPAFMCFLFSSRAQKSFRILPLFTSFPLRCFSCTTGLTIEETNKEGMEVFTPWLAGIV